MKPKDKELPEAERERPIPSKKKDKKRWCKGKVGTEHTPQVFPYYDQTDWKFAQDWKKYQCTGCGKILGFHIPNRFLENSPKPEWLIEWERTKQAEVERRQLTDDSDDA